MRLFEPHESVAHYIGTSRKYFMEAYEIISGDANEAFSLSKLSDGDTILEFGGGEGWMTINLSRHTKAKFIFNDKDPHMIELARMNFREALIEGRVEIMDGEIEKAAIPENSVDFIISRGAIHFTDYRKVFANIVKWLKPGRCCLVGCGLGWNLSEEYQKKIDEFNNRKKSGDNGKAPDKFDEMTVEGYKYLLDEFFDDDLEYIKMNNMNGLFFEVKKAVSPKKFKPCGK